MTKSSWPVVDLDGSENAVAHEIRNACIAHGFFYVVNHHVDAALFTKLEALAKGFFSRSERDKNEIAMAHGGAAWRGYFPVGGELTSGAPDVKEGLYFGAEIARDDPRVVAGLPLHGPNLFPRDVGFRDAVLDAISGMTALGHTLMRALAESLALPRDYFANRYTSDPTVLFRIFHYPAAHAIAALDPASWGVGEHTDYGLLTMLKQDDVGGLEVKHDGEWIHAPPIDGSFVCNIGDMLERMTGGLYRSTPHRVRSHPTRNRLSFPFFFDPNWDARITPLDLPPATSVCEDRRVRWDSASVFDFGGTYGEYLVCKVKKVFPELFARSTSSS